MSKVKEKELSEKEKALQARHEAAKLAGAKVVIIIEDVNGVDKVIYCRVPHRKSVGIWRANYKTDPLEANFNLIRSCVIEEISDKDIFIDPSNATYIAIADEAAAVANIIEIKKSSSLIL